MISLNQASTDEMITRIVKFFFGETVFASHDKVRLIREKLELVLPSRSLSLRTLSFFLYYVKFYTQKRLKHDTMVSSVPT